MTNLIVTDSHAADVIHGYRWLLRQSQRENRDLRRCLWETLAALHQIAKDANVNVEVPARHPFDPRAGNQCNRE